MENKLRMKRHESFSIREGWLTKGCIELGKDERVFSSPDAVNILGIGSNMVKGLKYWMIATGLAEEAKGLQISDFGKLINKFDPYLEDVFSWWLIHINLILNKNDAYLYNIFFNKMNAKTFSKKDIFEKISEQLSMERIEFNEKILLDEVNMIIKTYTIDEKIDNPENNFICPLTDLKLIKKVGKEIYEKNSPMYRNLNYLVIFYLLQRVMQERTYISIDEFIKCENSPIKLLNLDKNILNEYLDEIKRAGLIEINRTAGLNMIYINKNMSLEEIMIEYYG